MICGGGHCTSQAVDWAVWEDSSGRRRLVGVCESHDLPEPPPGWVEIGGGGDLALLRSLFDVSIG